jgi:L-alanine-DL-glutamate epimerase-like enolase superfamily enzyme
VQSRVVRLELVNPWRIAHGVSTERSTVILEHDGGYGEAAIVPYLGESSAEILSALASFASNRLEHVRVGVRGDAVGSIASRGARCAVDLALHDAECRARGVPLWNVLGINAASPIQTSFTIAIDTPDEMARRARAAEASILKLKMGGVDDEACVEAVRGVTNATLRLDANGGWSREEAARLIPRLARFKIELVEQPVAIEDRDGFAWLRAQQVGVPIFADESVSTVEGVDALAHGVDGIVIKLRKFGGLLPARAAIERARSLGLRTMMGCMIESSLAVTAAAHLALHCDLADLDAPLLIRNDPFSGLTYRGSAVLLPPGPGIGAVPRVGN